MNSFLYSLNNDIEAQEKLLKIYRKKASSKYTATVTGFTSHSKSYFKISSPVEIDGKTMLKQKTLHKEEEYLVEKYAEHALAEKMIDIMESNIALQKSLLDSYKPYSFNDVVATLSKTYQSVDFEDDPHRKAAKLQEASKSRAFRTENLTQPTAFGLYVRSKSEAIIANMLAAREIPFIYEAELSVNLGVSNVSTSRDETSANANLGRDAEVLADGDTEIVADAEFKPCAGKGFNAESRQIKLHPDFTILLSDGSKILWEHLGLLSSEGYAGSLCEKIMAYHHAGYNINSNLFLTTDTHDGRLDMVAVMNVLTLISAKL